MVSKPTPYIVFGDFMPSMIDAVPIPHRVQLSRKKGWRMPPNTLSVARPHRWGNPYKVGSSIEIHDADGRIQRIENLSAANAVRLYRLWLSNWDIQDRQAPHPFYFPELAGKNLACFCPIGQPCHADVLLELANPKEAQ